MSASKFPRNLANAFLLASVLLGSVANILAQTSAPDVPGKDETFVLSTFQVSAAADKGYRAGNSVSATRVDTPIKNLPFSISAFTPQFITDIGARDLYDVAQYAPGVTNASVEFVSGSTTYAIRGFNQNPQRNGFAGEAYVDAATIERVEVVKGPASLLYGEVAPGGAVNYITKRPTKKAVTSVAVKVGSHDYLRTSIDYNQPLVQDKLLFRFNGAWENDIEYYKPGQARTTVLAPTLTWLINDRVSVTFDYQNLTRRETPPFGTRLPTSRIVAPLPASGILSTASVLQRASGEDPGFLGFYPLPEDFNISANNDRRFSEMESFNTELTAKLNENWTARANFNWSKYKIWFKGTGLGQINITVPARYFPTGTAYPATANAAYLAAVAVYASDLLLNPNLALEAPFAQMQRRFNLQEGFGRGKASQVEVAGKYVISGIELKPLFGASYLEYRDATRTRQPATALFAAPWDMYNPATWNRDTDYNADTIPLTQYDIGIRRSKAIYGVINANMFNGRLFGVVGGRYTRTSGANDNYFNPAASIGKNRSSKLTPQVGLGWKPHREVMLYASYSSSFQNGIANLQFANVPSGPAKPATSEGYEFGVKTDLFGGRVSSTLAVYEIEQRDRIIAFNTTSPTGIILVNRTQGTLDRSRGVELEVTWSPVNQFQLYVSGALNDVRVRETPVGTEYLLGSHPENTVKALANVWSRYSFNDGPLKGLWIGAGLNYSGKKAQRVNNPALFSPAYTLINSAIGYDWKWQTHPATLSFNWNNMTNENYFPAAFLRGRPSVITFELKLKY